jgi:3-oxoacyl-[acyl-carrier protein] reductase
MQEVRKQHSRYCLNSEHGWHWNGQDLKLTDGNPENVMQAEDIAELIIAQLKLTDAYLLKMQGFGQQTHN